MKTGALRPIFCLAYFTMTYVTLQEQILEQLKELEQFVQRYESELEQPSPEKSQRLSCSPDVNRLDIANIAINTTVAQQDPLDSSQATAQIAAPAELAEYAMLSAASYAGSTSQSRASVVRCTPEAVSPSAAASAGPNKSSAESAMTSAFLNQMAQHTTKMEMFGSHFKACGLADDLAFPPASAVDALDAQQQVLPQAELAMQPISSIEEPTSSSFLQQSSQGGL